MIQLITDSGSDILAQEAKELGITVLPLKVNFAGTEYLDGKTITHKEFYEKLIETDIMPTTSQVPPAEFEEAFRNAVQEGKEVLCITLSKKLSGCYQSAMIARDDILEDEKGAKISVIDSENACLGQRVLVDLAIRLIQSGKSLDEITAEMETVKKRVRLVALVDTLEYLIKGGRLSKGVGFVAEMLSIKPVVAVEHGEVVVLGKARGSKNANNKLSEMVTQSGGIDFTKPFTLAYSGLSTALLEKYISDSKQLFEEHVTKEELPIASIGATIGTHVGPGAIGVAFFAKN
ncbi:MAG: DegV family protein [Acetatifactor sp.]|nr:DegV family protein [Acetatifactor sp.]